MFDHLLLNSKMFVFQVPICRMPRSNYRLVLWPAVLTADCNRIARTSHDIKSIVEPLIRGQSTPLYYTLCRQSLYKA